MTLFHSLLPLFSSPVLPFVFFHVISSSLTLSCIPLISHSLHHDLYSTQTPYPGWYEAHGPVREMGLGGRGDPGWLRLLLTYNNEDYERLINEIGKTDIAPMWLSVCVCLFCSFRLVSWTDDTTRVFASSARICAPVFMCERGNYVYFKQVCTLAVFVYVHQPVHLDVRIKNILKGDVEMSALAHTGGDDAV